MVFTSETIQNLKKSLSSGLNDVLSLKPFKVSKQMSTNKLIFDITFFVNQIIDLTDGPGRSEDVCLTVQKNNQI